MSGLLLAIAGALHPVTSGPKAPVQIILTSGTSWTVPADWNSANNKIECIGAGRAGGGAYARKNNVALTAGANVFYQIGATATTQSVADTWLGSAGVVKAVGSIGATGGQASDCVGDVKFSGGSRSGSISNGNGGAAGPNGDGLPNSGSTGGTGDAGFGGAGGLSGQPGGNGTEWGTVGSGGGGGGGSGFAGGLYGGGGSISGGAPGVIVITYTPA